MSTKPNRPTHNLAIEKVLLHHDAIHSLGILKREEAESARSAGVIVPHHGAFDNLPELDKIIV